jgi:hypothetical protein
MQSITQPIPQDELDVIRTACAFFIESAECGSVECSQEEFDTLINLAYLSEYQISVTLTKDELDSFKSRHGVEFPDYNSPNYQEKKKRDFLISEYGQEIVDQVSWDLKHVGYDSVKSAYMLLKKHSHLTCLVSMNALEITK